MKNIKIGIAAAFTAMTLLLTGCRDSGPTEIETARSNGIALMEQAQYEAAIASFEQAYGLCDEKMPETKTDIALFKATCQYRLEDYEGVKNTCTEILNLGENKDAFYLRGTAFLQSGEMDAAKADFDNASLLAPEDYSLFLNIYKQYEAKNLSAPGDEYLQKALHIPGETAEDYYQKGCIYFYLKDYEKAREMLSAPVEAEHKDALELMGQVYLAQKDTVHARNVYQTYMEKFGETAQAYNGLVLCDLADASYDNAIALAQKGLALDGEDGKKDLRYNMIVAYEKKLDFETAKAEAETFIQMYPEDEAGKKEYDFLSTR